MGHGIILATIGSKLFTSGTIIRKEASLTARSKHPKRVIDVDVSLRFVSTTQLGLNHHAVVSCVVILNGVDRIHFKNRCRCTDIIASGLTYAND